MSIADWFIALLREREGGGMGYFDSILYGFQVVMTQDNLMACLIGVIGGTLVGVLPGIGPIGAMAVLLPAVFHADPTTTIITLAGIYYGCMYGGSTTSILLNIPGETSSVCTCLDGYEMARQGRAGPALGIAACGSFIAGTISILGLILIATPLARAALKFGPSEYFALMCLGLVILTYLTQGSVLKSLMMALVGVIVGNMGQDMFTGLPRFSFGIKALMDGVGIVPVSVGLFGIAEVLINLDSTMEQNVYKTRLANLWPSFKDWKESIGAILRGSGIGFFIGILPGGGAVLSSFLSYALEKKISKTPERFGKGEIRGVAGPESANNAAAGSSLIPLLSLGIPANGVMALVAAALIIQGIQPGPLLIKSNPEIFWGLIASMWIGNLLLLILNLPLVGLWVQVLKVPYRFLFPMILLFALIGAYTIDSTIFDIFAMLVFGLLGYLMRKFGYEGAPLLLAFVLGPLLEKALRQALLISNGSFFVFIDPVGHPISCITLGVVLLLLLSNFIPLIRRKHEDYEKL